MKVSVGMIAYNEEIMIEASIRSVYDYVDEIVIIDGSPWGPSADKTSSIALSVGSKVRVINGTYRNADGLDHKVRQRQAYLNEMVKGYNNWCILHDADEVFSKENIERLVNHLKSANPETMLFGYPVINFIGDCWHTYEGGEPRITAAWRLLPGMMHLNHHRVGIPKVVNWSREDPPIRIMLDDVVFHHYGHALTFKKDEIRGRCYLERGDFHELGYEPHEWRRYKKEILLPHWERKKRLCKTDEGLYTGEHPEAVESFIGTFWPKEFVKS